MKRMGKATKYDSNKKVRPELLPSKATEEVMKVFTFGAEKYGDFNWRKGLEFSRLWGAAQRHQMAFWQGQDLDEESGLPHIAHAVANLMMLMEMGCEWDNRPYKGKGEDNERNYSNSDSDNDGSDDCDIDDSDDYERVKRLVSFSLP